jgi:hypothetical protein
MGAVLVHPRQLKRVIKMDFSTFDVDFILKSLPEAEKYKNPYAMSESLKTSILHPA